MTSTRSRRKTLMPAGFARSIVGRSGDRAYTVAGKIQTKIKATRGAVGVAIDETGTIYAVKHLSLGFKKILHYHSDQYVVGVYNHESDRTRIAEDILSFRQQQH